MLTITLTCGIPGSGKSTWAKEEVSKDPDNITRVSRDDLRVMMHNYHYSSSNEKLVVATKLHIVRQALLANKHVIIDETNLNPRNFQEICNLVKSLKIDCQVQEKVFFIELEEAIARDAQRTGHSHVGEKVIRQFWSKSGKDNFKNYQPKVEIFSRHVEPVMPPIVPINVNLPPAVICDLDGTLSLFNVKKFDGTSEMRHPGAHYRSPYDASNCDEDTVNLPVLTVLNSLHQLGNQIIFCSGREDKYQDPTERFLKKHVTFPYQLHMRQTGDNRKDALIKEEIYHQYIAPNYRVFLVMDDRSQVIALWRNKLGLPTFQVNDGDF